METRPTNPTRNAARLRVMCVDDNPLVVEALAFKLGLLGGFEWLRPLGDATSLVREVQRQRPDVVLLDLDMPGREPLEALAELSELGSTARVLIFSGHTRPDLVDRAIDAGAWGFISKHADVEAIVAAIRRVADGGFILGHESEVGLPPVGS